jgi:ubiquinone/menaquinone biosynthesis C-methylase UbiE
VSAYDEIADWYDTWVGTHAMSDDPFFPAVESLMGDIAGRRICDLACGQGRVARYLAERGARVVGVDLSANLLEIARRHEAARPRGIEYLHADARALDGVADSSFDGVVCFMALMDIPDLPATLHSVARVLRPDGWFVFAILHPCFHTARSGEIEAADGVVRTIGAYFNEGHWRSETRTGPPGKVGSYHRTLATYVNALTDAGLALERLVEPRGNGVTAGAAPSLAGMGRPVWQQVPAVLAARCVKRSG